MAKVALAVLCLPLICWFLGMILYAILPPVVFWLLVVLLAVWAGSAIVRLSKG